MLVGETIANPSCALCPRQALPRAEHLAVARDLAWFHRESRRTPGDFKVQNQ